MSKKGIKTNKRGAKRILFVLLALLLIFVCFLGALELGVVVQKSVEIHWSPDYEKEDIEPLLYKKTRTGEDYEKIYRQTGLTKLGVEDMIEQGQYARILTIQEKYFTDYEKTRDNFVPFTYSEHLDGYGEFAPLQEGDILITDAIFCSWFRYGHAALVIDAQNGKVVDAVSIGARSGINYASQFKHYSKFLILRPKASKEVKQQVVKYAKENLVDLPYQMSVGILCAKDVENLLGTHCGHLVWYAYNKFGVDLDSTGGMIVTPQDFVHSPNVELVQTFGFDPDTLWS